MGRTQGFHKFTINKKFTRHHQTQIFHQYQRRMESKVLSKESSSKESSRKASSQDEVREKRREADLKNLVVAERSAERLNESLGLSSKEGAAITPSPDSLKDTDN